MKFHLALIAFATTALLGCQVNRPPPPPDNIKLVEDILGKGWQCMATPTGFDGPGSIFTLDKKGEKRDEVDLGDAFATAEQPRLFGSAQLNSSYSAAFTLALLKGAVPNLEFSANASVAAASHVKISLDGGSEKRSYNPDYTKAKEWAFEHKDIFDQHRRAFVVRNAFLADSMDYHVDKNFVAALGGNIKFKELAMLSSNLDPKEGALPATPDSQYELKQKFPKPLVVCILPDEIVLPLGITGAPQVEVRSLDTDLAIAQSPIPSAKGSSYKDEGRP